MRALYRRYRPLTLADVIGQEQVTGPLIGALKDDKISHAYLFIGPRGTGKTSVARIFAHEVNGFKYELEDDYVDIIEIDGASNRGIDNIRELREKVMIAPTSGKYKVYIIDEVHMLTKEAFNALLKTLEEPPKHVIFIMATTDAYKVPVTITSRAQTYTFKLADHKVMFDHLKKICEKEKIKIDDAALDIIVKRGGGSFRDTLSLLDQISTLSSEKITKDLVISAMGLAADEKIKELLNSYVSSDNKNITAILKDLLATGIKAETLTEELISAIMEEPRPELMGLLSKLPEVKAPYAEAKLLVALINAESVVAPAVSIQSRKTSPAMQEKPVIKTVAEETEEKPVEEAPKKIVPNGEFNWSEFLEKVGHLNDAVYMMLSKVEHEFDGTTLHIFPLKKVEKLVLSKDNNIKVLIEAGGVGIKIHEVGEKGSSEKDSLISKMSDIMGGEVQNDAGGNPF